MRLQIPCEGRQLFADAPCRDPHARFEAPILGTVLLLPPSLLFLARPIRKSEGAKVVEPPTTMARVIAASNDGRIGGTQERLD